MPESDQPLVKKQPDPLVDALLRMSRESEDARRMDFSRQPMPLLLNTQKNCMRCHETPPQRELNLTPLYKDQRLLARFDAPVAKPVDKTPEERLAELPPVGKVPYVFGRLPDKFSLSMKDGKVSFTTDFRGFLEAIPGVKPDKTAGDLLGGLKSIDLQGDKFTARMDKPQSVKVNVDLKVAKGTEIRFGTDKNPNLSFEVKFDPKDPDGVSLKNIEGLTLVTDIGLEIAVRGASLKTRDGKSFVEVTVENPIKVPPTITISQPLEKVVQGVDGNIVKNIVHALADAKASLDKKDFGPYIEHVTEPGLKATLGKIAEGLTSITKDGDKITLIRNNGVIDYSLGGPNIKVYPTVSFRIGKDADAPKLYDVQGIAFSVPLPSELKIGDNYYTGIKEIGLGYAASDGSRTLTVKTDGEVRSASVRLSGQMQPATDGHGTFYVHTNVKNILSDRRGDNLDVSLRITNGQLNMSSTEVADLISKATWQAADLSPAGAGMVIISGASKAYSSAAKVYSWLFE